MSAHQRRGRAAPLAIAGLSLAAALLAAPAGAEGQAHRYYVTTVGDTQAEVVDLASRSQTGGTVRLDIVMLRRSPAHVGGLDIYWADGAEEVDCQGHHTRMELLAGYTLDRDRRFDAPQAAFRPWIDDRPGTAARGIEDFVCRGVQADWIVPVASLGAFRAGYLKPSGAEAAAPPPQAPPAASAAAPEGLSPYYVVANDADTADLVDLAHRRRSGDVATVTAYILSAKPMSGPSGDMYWVERTQEYDCAGHRQREAVEAVLSLDRSARSPNPDRKFGDWRSDESGTPAADAEALVCHDQAGTLMGVDDLGVFQKQFFEFAKGGR